MKLYLSLSAQTSYKNHAKAPSSGIRQSPVHVLRALGKNPESRPGKSSAITAAEVLFPNEWKDILQRINDKKAGTVPTST
jgi:hypothetical protein